jgi:outer membrane lipoprotein
MDIRIDRAAHRLAVPLAAALGLAACASVPQPLEGEYSAITAEAASDAEVGSRVRWGGGIVDTRPGRESTCIEILARSLDARARPVESDETQGRFLACREGFEDPAIYESGRDITVTGRLSGFVEGKIGEFEYVYPRVEADKLFLWSDRREYHYRDPWYRDPWWPYYRPWYYPYWTISGHVVIDD